MGSNSTIVGFTRLTAFTGLKFLTSYYDNDTNTLQARGNGRQYGQSPELLFTLANASQWNTCSWWTYNKHGASLPLTDTSDGRVVLHGVIGSPIPPTEKKQTTAGSRALTASRQPGRKQAPQSILAWQIRTNSSPVAATRPRTKPRRLAHILHEKKPGAGPWFQKIPKSHDPGSPTFVYTSTSTGAASYARTAGREHQTKGAGEMPSFLELPCLGTGRVYPVRNSLGESPMMPATGTARASGALDSAGLGG
ncbi:hypothetical protein GE09DRAFT_230341 [Coniochaeta sp. 2T2.1]|nr:hypothetical protein GE09DRAFT_230341 [Coniochaeta sp. 2T2.1]